MNWKPILVGLVLIPIPINSLLILLARVSPTFAVPFYNVILFLFVLLVINGFGWAVRLQPALKSPELGLIYIMLSCSIALTCNHLVTELMPVIGYLFGTLQPRTNGNPSPSDTCPTG